MNSPLSEPGYKIVVACDHAGVEMKSRVVSHLMKHHRVSDLGVSTPERVDYPDVVDRAVNYFWENHQDFLVLICGTGIGMCIAANKKKGILSALVNSVYTATMARQHNHANCLTLPGRVDTLDPIEKILDSFFNTAEEEGRHQERVKKILDREKTDH